jgi:ribosomal protein S11
MKVYLKMMKSFSKPKSSLFVLNSIRLKKKSVYSKKVLNYVSKLKFFLNKKQKDRKLSFFSVGKSFKSPRGSLFSKKKGPFVLYSICFSFSAINTFLYVTDALGNLKFRASAGLLNFKGKLKKSRFQILKLFFKELRKLKINILKNKPVSLHLQNVGSYRRLIIRNLKNFFFIQVIQNYQTHAYNGCRKKKKLRK